MPSAPPNEVPHQAPPVLVVAIAVLQLVGGLVTFFFCGIQLAVWVIHEMRTIPLAAFVFGVPFCLGILSVVASVGLFRLKEWGRRASLWLVSLSTLSCALFLIFYHPDEHFDIFRPIAEILLVIFIFLSLCYWAFLNAIPDSPFRK